MHIVRAWYAILLIAGPGVAISQSPASQDASGKLFQEARALIGKNNGQAFELMQQAAQTGSVDATGGLGYFYAQGLAVPKDEATAAEYFQKGAEGGSARSQLNYAVILISGQGVTKDPAAAVPWLEKAAEAGVPEAQERLGLALLHGDLIAGVPRDDKRARKLLEAAAGAGLPAAQNGYGFMLGSAMGGSADETAAEDWYRQAAEQGEPKSMANLGRMLLNSGAKNRARRVEGLQWLMVANTLDEVTAKNTLTEYQVNADGAEWSEAQKEADRIAYKLRFTAGLAKQRKSLSAAAENPSPAPSPTAQDGE